MAGAVALGRRNFLLNIKLITRTLAEWNMRRPPLKRSDTSISDPLPPLPEAAELRRFAFTCRTLAEQETDSRRKRVFQEMESAWKAVAAQVARTDDLMTKMRSIQCHSLN